jgi:hypothetical protein
MRVANEGEHQVNNLVLPRRALLKGLVGLIAAPAVVKAENLMPIVVWRPPVVRREGWVLYNGVRCAKVSSPPSNAS